MTSLVLSSSPLSVEYRTRLSATFREELVFTNLAEIRRQPLLTALRTLRSAAAKNCYIAIEDDSSAAAIPILQTVGSATWPRALRVVSRDLSTKRLSPAALPVAIAATIYATANGMLAVRSATTELRHLSVARRLEVTTTPTLGHMLYLNTNLWFGLKVGGSVGHVAGVVNAFSRQGVDVSLATASDPAMIAPSVRIRHLAPPKALALPFELNYYSFQNTVLRSLMREHVDLCYQRLSLGSYAGVVLSRKLRIPLLIEYNGSEAWIAKNWGRRLRYESLALSAEDASLRHAHVVVTVSSALRDELLERGVDDERIVCHPNGVDPTVFDPARYPPQMIAAVREAHDIPESATVVTFLGTFGRWHGAEVLARAIAQLGEACADWLERSTVRFMFVGDGLMLGDVQATIKTSRAARYVRFTGLVPQEEAPAYLAASDIVVAPHVPNADGSRFFGSPTKLFEYMAMGRAILASNLDQLGEVLSDGIDVRQVGSANVEDHSEATAVLVVPGDQATLAQGIRLLVDNRAFRTSLGNNARRLVMHRYTWDHNVAVVVQRIRQIGTPKRAG